MNTITLDLSSINLYGLLLNNTNDPIDTLYYDIMTNTYYLGSENSMDLMYEWIYTSYNHDESPCTATCCSSLLDKIGTFTNITEGVIEGLVKISPI